MTVERKLIEFECYCCKQIKPISEFYKNVSKTNKLSSECKQCNKMFSFLRRKKYPWSRTQENIKQRCNNINCKAYKYYGGRGIKCLITKEDIKKLWFRDNAKLMNRPSIDRIDNDGDYCLENCRFIEMSENGGKAKKDNAKKCLQSIKNGDFIKIWNSAIEAGRQLKICHSSIYECINGNRKSAGGFKWQHVNSSFIVKNRRLYKTIKNGNNTICFEINFVGK